MKKRLLAMLMCATMICSLCACGESGTEDTNKDNAQNVESTENSQVQNDEETSVKVLADYSDMSVVLSGDYEITEKVLNSYLTNVLYSNGVGLMKVTDRDTVQAGDIVKTDYTGYVDGKAFQGGAATNQWIDVSNNCGVDVSTGELSGGYIDGFTDGLIGAKIEEPKDGPVVFPETYNQETTLDDGSKLNLANQPATFEFVVHEIYVEVNAENITDEFVAENLSKAYSVSTVEELMAVLEKELAYNYTVNYIIANSEFSISEEYLNERVEDCQKYFEEFYCQGVDLETYLSYYGYTLEEMRVQWLSQINNQIQAELVFEAIVANDNLTIDEDAHNAYIQGIMSANGEFFPDAATVYRYAGAGSAEAGEAYMKNQTAVKDYFIANYDK